MEACKCGNNKFITMSVVGEAEPDGEPYTNHVEEGLKEEHKHLEGVNVMIDINICTKCEEVFTYDGRIL